MSLAGTCLECGKADVEPLCAPERFDFGAPSLTVPGEVL